MTIRHLKRPKTSGVEELFNTKNFRHLIIQLAKRLDAHVIEIASDRYANLIATLGVG
nr:hypothetical protein [Latilactobacillus curvatus]